MWVFVDDFLKVYTSPAPCGFIYQIFQTFCLFFLYTYERGQLCLTHFTMIKLILHNFLPESAQKLWES